MSLKTDSSKPIFGLLVAQLVARLTADSGIKSLSQSVPIQKFFFLEICYVQIYTVILLLSLNLEGLLAACISIRI